MRSERLPLDDGDGWTCLSPFMEDVDLRVIIGVELVKNAAVLT